MYIYLWVLYLCLRIYVHHIKAFCVDFSWQFSTELCVFLILHTELHDLWFHWLHFKNFLWNIYLEMGANKMLLNCEQNVSRCIHIGVPVLFVGLAVGIHFTDVLKLLCVPNTWMCYIITSLERIKYCYEWGEVRS